MKKRMSAVILAVVMLLSAFAAPLVSGTTVQAKKKKAAGSGIKKLEKKLAKKKGHKFAYAFKLDDSFYAGSEDEEWYKEENPDKLSSDHAITIKLKKDKNIYFTDLITVGKDVEKGSIERYLVKMTLKTSGKNKFVQVTCKDAYTYHDYDYDANDNRIDLGLKTRFYKTRIWNVAPAAYKYDPANKENDDDDRAFFLAMKAWNTYLHAATKLTVNKLGFKQFIMGPVNIKKTTQN